MGNKIKNLQVTITDANKQRIVELSEKLHNDNQYQAIIVDVAIDTLFDKINPMGLEDKIKLFGAKEQAIKNADRIKKAKGDA